MELENLKEPSKLEVMGTLAGVKGAAEGLEDAAKAGIVRAYGVRAGLA